jgi:hypothetical protein
MSRRMRLKTATVNSSHKLPIAAETRFQKPDRKKLIKGDPEQEGGIFISRIFAKGGYVVTQYSDYKMGKDGQVLMPPKEALRRAQSLMAIPKEYIMEGMIQAIINAAHAAMQQTLEGGNPLFNQNKELLNIPKQTEMIKAEIAAERKKDPALNEEMSRIEAENKLKRG